MEGTVMNLWQAVMSTPVLGLVIAGVTCMVLLIVLHGARLSTTIPAKVNSSGSIEDEKVDRNNPINIFPPSRRASLLQLLPDSELGTREIVIPLKDLRSHQIPTTRIQPLDENDHFTSTSLLTQEIKALGRFPDYSVLSGVPHPTPAPSFDITKATFRPFRPFRWTYHQTMGEQS